MTTGEGSGMLAKYSFSQTCRTIRTYKNVVIHAACLLGGHSDSSLVIHSLLPLISQHDSGRMLVFGYVVGGVFFYFFESD